MSRKDLSLLLFAYHDFKGLVFNHFLHKNSKLQENTDSRSVLPFYYTTTLTTRVLDSDLGSGLSAEAASIFPHGPRSLRVHCGCCKSFSYSCLTPTSRPGAHLTNFHFRWACLCACVGVCVPARVHREHQHCVHPTSEWAWRGEMERNDFLAHIWLCRNSPALLSATVHSYSLRIWIVPSDRSRRGSLCS